MNQQNRDENPVNIPPDLMQKLGRELESVQQIWLSGYLYGLAMGSGQAMPAPALAMAPNAASARVTILYGSQTGNSKGVAVRAGEAARMAGLEAEVMDMNDYPLRRLSSEKILLVVVSTYGEGEPPVSAETIYEHLFSSRAPQLKELQFAVLSLGDKSYTHFCKTGIDFDTQLEKLGATRMVQRVDCDTDFHDLARAWTQDVIAHIKSISGAIQLQESVLSDSAEAHSPAVPVYDRQNPYRAAIIAKVLLNGRGSPKETWHIELSLEGSGLQYEPGDSLGVYIFNPPALVQDILLAVNLGGDNPVTVKNRPMSLRKALTEELELTLLNRDVLQALADKKEFPALSEVLADTEKLRNYLYGLDLLDVLQEYHLAWKAQDLVDVLRPLQPRLYSISSSQQYVPDEVHITVAALRYHYRNRSKKGAASTYLADLLNVNDEVNVFIEKNEYFKLPAEDTRDVIMIGPGTGIAPFRAFMQEREVREAKGKNWLFFGNPHFTTDFLYQTEWQKMVKAGMLQKIDLAFSRDTPEKVYVQDRIRLQAKEICKWLDGGASLYVCGDKNKMARDVQNALEEVIAGEKGYSREEAANYVKNLKRSRRYLEDVY